jgi:hypothetical protein
VQTPFFEAIADPEQLDQLMAVGVRREREMDSIFSPYISPLAAWWRTMDAVWPAGVTRLTYQGVRIPFGLFRLWEAGSQALPHQDVLRREAPELEMARFARRQFGVNLYLSSGEGGELELWDRDVSDAEWRESHLPGSYGYSRDVLGPPDHVLSPQAGSLVIVDTEKVHAIRPVTRGSRLTMSGFIAYLGDDQPLVCWS